MAEIKISDLSLNGNDLFDDDEGFMNELGEDVFEQVKGGEAIVYPTVYPKTTTNYSPLCLPTGKTETTTWIHTPVIL